MPRKKKMSVSVGAGMTAKQLRRKKPYNSDMMVPIEPITPNQRTAFAHYNDCLLYTSPSPRDSSPSRMPSSA